MKKILIIAGSIFTVLTFINTGFAASYGKSLGQSYMVIVGTIEAIDQAKHLFVIKDKDDGRSYGLSAWPSDMASLSQGNYVKVTVPLPGQLVSKISSR